MLQKLFVYLFLLAITLQSSSSSKTLKTEDGEWKNCQDEIEEDFMRASNTLPPVENSNHVPSTEKAAGDGVASLFDSWGDSKDTTKDLSRFVKIGAKLAKFAGPLADVIGTFFLGQTDSAELQAIKNLSKEMKQQFQRVHNRLKKIYELVKNIPEKIAYANAIENYNMGVRLRLKELLAVFGYFADLKDNQKIPSTRCFQSLTGNSVDSAIGPNKGKAITIPIRIPDSFTLNDVKVIVNADHSFVGDLSLTLVSPGGSSVILGMFQKLN